MAAAVKNRNKKSRRCTVAFGLWVYRTEANKPSEDHGTVDFEGSFENLSLGLGGMSNSCDRVSGPPGRGFIQRSGS